MRRVRLSLVAPFETSFGVQAERDILLLKAITSDGEGWGECVAGEEPTYSSEYVEGCQHVLIHHLLPRLLARSGLQAEDVGPVLRPVHGHHMAKAAIEMALLDAQLRASGESFGAYFGAVRPAVDAGVSVGIHKTIPELLETVGDYLEQGYRRSKLKDKPGADLAARRGGGATWRWRRCRTSRCRATPRRRTATTIATSRSRSCCATGGWTCPRDRGLGSRSTRSSSSRSRTGSRRSALRSSWRGAWVHL